MWGGGALSRIVRHTSVYLGRCGWVWRRYALFGPAEGTANAVRVHALPGFKSPSLRSSQALSLGTRGEGLMRHSARSCSHQNRLKPDGVSEASFPCERQQAGVGPAALEERWS